jgi:hypothetical protein
MEKYVSLKVSKEVYDKMKMELNGFYKLGKFAEQAILEKLEKTKNGKKVSAQAN